MQCFSPEVTGKGSDEKGPRKLKSVGKSLTQMPECLSQLRPPERTPRPEDCCQWLGSSPAVPTQGQPALLKMEASANTPYD